MDTPLPLFVDLYELTMAQAYFFENFQENAVFSTFVRKLPQNRNFLVACGLDNVLNFLENCINASFFLGALTFTLTGIPGE